MEYIYRALNEYDLKINPLEHGLINKKTIMDAVMYCLNISFISLQYRFQEQYGRILTEKDLNEIVKDTKSAYVNGCIPLIVSNANEKSQKITNLIEGLTSENLEFRYTCCLNLIEIISSLNGHLTKGSEFDTYWISFSKSLLALQKYYLNQEKHQIAIVKSQINNIFDEKNIAYDLSSEEKVYNNSLLINKGIERGLWGEKTYKYTDINSRAMRYAIKSKEIIYYNNVPKEKILTIIGALETDLALNNMLNLEFYEEHFSLTNQFYHILLLKLKRNFEHTEILNLLEKHYIENIPLSKINPHYLERLNLIKLKKEILNYLTTIDSPLLKKTLPNRLRVMEELSISY